MVKMFALLVPRDGLSAVAFHRHWREVHGPLVARVRRIDSYVQHHRTPWQPDDLPVLPHGGTAEVSFADAGVAAGLAADPEYLAGAFHDEDSFHHMDRLTAFLAQEHVALAGPPVGREDGGIKVMQFVRRAPGLAPAPFAAAWGSPDGEEADALAALGVVRSSRWAQLAQAGQEPVDALRAGREAAGPPSYDGVRELWWPDEWSFAAARLRAPDAWARLVGGPALDPGVSGYLVTRPHRVVWPDAG